MLAGFCGWADLFDATARLESTVPQDVRERESSGRVLGNTSSRAQLLTGGVLASRSGYGTRPRPAAWFPHLSPGGGQRGALTDPG